MYLGGVIVFGTTLSVTAIALITAALFWRKGYFDNVEAPKYRMMDDDK
jgi:nitrogen fixation-related uncharacterized protein